MTKEEYSAILAGCVESLETAWSRFPPQERKLPASAGNKRKQSRKKGWSVMIRIFTDTAANLPSEILQSYGIEFVPLSYSVNGESAVQTAMKDFDGKTFYGAMRNGAEVQTSMANMNIFLDPFRRALERGEDVLYIGISGGISGTSHAAYLAAEELKKQYPDRKIVTINSLAASLGEGLQVIEAAEQAEKGASIEEIAEDLTARLQQMCQFFTVDDLKYLRKGGRISGMTAMVGSLLQIKPILRGDEEGKIVSCGKARGKKAALVNLALRYGELALDKSAPIGIAHADDEEGTAFLIEELKKQGFSGKCLTVMYEPVTGAHVGPGTVALFFRGKHK